ncbi:hypothetical protein CSC18_0401 [Klebsiella aerogenes]|nr:hypothetical protein CSC18_0401 [Klebsiella aerogenes]
MMKRRLIFVMQITKKTLSNRTCNLEIIMKLFHKIIAKFSALSF